MNILFTFYLTATFSSAFLFFPFKYSQVFVCEHEVSVVTIFLQNDIMWFFPRLFQFKQVQEIVWQHQRQHPLTLTHKSNFKTEQKVNKLRFNFANSRWKKLNQVTRLNLKLRLKIRKSVILKKSNLSENLIRRPFMPHLKRTGLLKAIPGKLC